MDPSDLQIDQVDYIKEIAAVSAFCGLTSNQFRAVGTPFHL